ncbi:MAG TPA: HD domain-containing protein [Cyclobacteriaceae bacterium]|nr:HD domain-containing protein [Cyclobacteriaceae bacterium]
MNSAEETVNEIFNLYEKYGAADYIGEPVSQLEHMSQAAQLAIREGVDDEVILAAFFHDIGHICVMMTEENNMTGYGVKSHEKIGADYLRAKGFTERMARLVEGHVQAKRYLTYKFPYYFNHLSEASKKTLEYQGGMMNATEAEEFEKDPLHDLLILMRKWDEMAKETNTPLINIDELKQRALIILKKELKVA